MWLLFCQHFLVTSRLPGTVALAFPLKLLVLDLQDKHKKSKKDDKLVKEAKKFLKQSEWAPNAVDCVLCPRAHAPQRTKYSKTAFVHVPPSLCIPSCSCHAISLTILASSSVSQS